MSEEQGKQTEQKTTESEQKTQEKSRKIELDEETYAALLDKLDELETAGKGQKRDSTGEGDEVDELAEEGRRVRGQQHQDVDLDQMTPRQLINFIRDDVSRNLGSPLLVAVNELKYTMEMDKLMRPEAMGGNGYVDLLDFKDEIMSLMLENPKITMKRAYTLAKAENPQKSSQNKKGEAKEEGERETRLRHLPPHPRKGSFGERPGSTESSVTDGEPKDLRAAASKAFDKVMKDREKE